MKQVKKAIIPAAGFGTRYLPATKTVPKEMFPVAQRPTILYIVEEAIQSGIEDIIIITARGKQAIEDFFDFSYELEDLLDQQGHHEWLEEVQRIRSMCNIISIRQKLPRGSGYALLSAESVIGKEPFAVLLSDEIMVHSSKPTTQRLIETYEERQLSTLAVAEVSKERVSHYGIVDGDFKSKDQPFKIKSIVEKPSIETAPSLLSVSGRYVFTPKIFEHLKSVSPDNKKEIQLTSAINLLIKDPGVLAQVADGIRYDAGNKFDYLRANIELTLKNSDIKDELTAYIKKLAKSL